MIYRHRFQNRVAESEFTLPACVLMAAILWWWPQCAFSLPHLMGWGLCMLTTYVVMETNNTQQLIRVRTRIMACVWLLLSACLPLMHAMGAPCIAASCLAVSYYLLMRTYQLRQPTGWSFHVFLFLALGSLFFPLMLALVPVFFAYQSVLMRSLTWKAFWAGAVGLIAPFWLWTGVCLWNADFAPMQQYFSTFAQLEWPRWEMYAAWPRADWISWGVLNFLCVVGQIHYWKKNYDDKIRVRMMIYIYVAQTFILQLALLLMPQHFAPLMALLLVSGSPLFAHYFALTNSWFSNAMFCLSLLLCLLLAVENLWMPCWN